MNDIAKMLDDLSELAELVDGINIIDPTFARDARHNRRNKMNTTKINQATYHRCYNSGWAASSRFRSGDLTSAEDRYLTRNGYANMSPEHHAWLDGWLDEAAGRDKWHLRDCPNHGNAEGECGEG